MEIKLTKDAEILICIMYKTYLERRKSGISKNNSRLFDVSSVLNKIVPKFPYEDLCETCRELDRAGFLECFYADDEPQKAYITDTAIIYMENRFVNGLTGILEYISKIKASIPFL